MTEAFSDDEDLLESGNLDSMSAMKTIAAIETAFGLKIPAGDVTYENFNSIAAMETYLGGRSA